MLDQERRDYLTAKYGLDRPPMNPALNTTVAAMLDAEQITESGRRHDDDLMFDPVRSNALSRRADAAMTELRLALAEDRIKFDSHDYDLDYEFDLDNPPTDAVFIYRPGSTLILVCCRAGASHDERKYRGTDYFSDMIGFFGQVDDYHRHGSYADFELRCTANISEGCSAATAVEADEYAEMAAEAGVRGAYGAEDYAGGTTRLMPVHRGQFLVLFRCCLACEAKATQDTVDGFILSDLESRAGMPDGGRIVDSNFTIAGAHPTPATSSPHSRWRAWWARVCSWAYPTIIGR